MTLYDKYPLSLHYKACQCDKSSPTLRGSDFSFLGAIFLADDMTGCHSVFCLATKSPPLSDDLLVFKADSLMVTRTIYNLNRTWFHLQICAICFCDARLQIGILLDELDRENGISNVTIQK